MTRALITKTLCETWMPTGLFMLALFFSEWPLGYILASFSEEVAGKFFQISLMQNVIKGLLGTDVPIAFDPATFSAIAWVHPAILTLLWSQVIAFCTRTPAAEVDRGTIDVLLSLPVSRLRLFVTETAVGMVYGALMIAVGLLGFWIGSFAIPADDRVEFGRLVVIAVNCYCVSLAIGALSLLASALSERRGRAVAAVAVVILPSFLVNFLAQFSETADRFVFLSFMHYYSPLAMLQQTGWPVADMLVLLVAAVVMWLVAVVMFTRRDIRTT